jgi:hypothetical protein
MGVLAEDCGAAPAAALELSAAVGMLVCRFAAAAVLNFVDL